LECGCLLEKEVECDVVGREFCTSPRQVSKVFVNHVNSVHRASGSVSSALQHHLRRFIL